MPERVQFLIHEATMKVALNGLSVFAHLLGEDEKAKAFDLLYDAAKQVLEEYEQRMGRMLGRVGTPQN